MKHKQLAIDLWNVQFQKLTKYAPVIIKKEGVVWGERGEGGRERERESDVWVVEVGGQKRHRDQLLHEPGCAH